jgi:fatty-acid peroxygenase
MRVIGCVAVIDASLPGPPARFTGCGDCTPGRPAVTGTVSWKDAAMIPYPYLLRRRRKAGAATLDVGPPGQRMTVVSGPAGARLFYDAALMRRRGAIPLPLRRVLFGVGAIHGLDGDDHRHRKALFLELLTPAAAREVAALAAPRWAARAGDPVDPARLFDEAVDVHAAAILEWTGVLASDTYPQLHRDLVAMVDGFGTLGPRYVRAYRARQRSERWARDVIRAVREGRIVAPDTPLAAIAGYRGRDGRPLPARVAGVELLNVVRPTVAVAYFVAFAADALAAHPQLRERLANGGDDVLEAFAHELRRYYPFVPMLAAKTRCPISVDGRRVRRGRRVLLDVYGTLHDPAVWDEPERFDLDRFLGPDGVVEPDPYAFLPQGGGDPVTGHRCPGEREAVELVKTAVLHLVTERPPVRSREGYPLDRLPTRPLTGVRP